MAFAGLLTTACNKDEEHQTVVPETKGEQTAVAFQLKANSLRNEISKKTFTPSYNQNNFSIYAFRLNEAGTAYLYEKTVSLSGVSYDADNYMLKGSTNLTIGRYKFVPVYGVSNQASVNTSALTVGSTVLTDDLLLSYDGANPLSEIFTERGTVADLNVYELGLTEGSNDTVKSVLKRAVSRVDVMFFKAVKDGNGYKELPYERTNALGGKTIEKITYAFTNVNNQMNFFSTNKTTSPIDTLNVDVVNNFANLITYGNGTVTTVGDDDYKNYDNVLPAHLINGAAHIFGTYLFPNNDASKNTKFQIYIKSTDGVERTITLSDSQKLAIERNKVTLVKIYILNNTDPTKPDEEEGHVFNTNVDFRIELETVWDGSSEVEGEINGPNV